MGYKTVEFKDHPNKPVVMVRKLDSWYAHVVCLSVTAYTNKLSVDKSIDKFCISPHKTDIYGRFTESVDQYGDFKRGFNKCFCKK